MTLINSNNESFYSLNNYGYLEKIKNSHNCNQWLNTIGKVSERLEIAHDKKQVVFLYRGEDRAVFCGKTGNESGNEPRYDHFFVIGSKAKSYLKNKDKHIRAIKQFDGEGKIKYIFDELNEISNCTGDKSMLSYFEDKEKFPEFKEKMLGISNRDHRLTIENFFLAFIHTLSSNPKDINAYSVLISSTRNLEVAKRFAAKGYIIAFWVSQPIENQAIDYINIENYINLLLKYDFPSLSSIHFPDESEVTIFSAIFPHNIFYVYDISNDRSIFNPYIIETNPEKVVTHGINVNQSTFTEKLQEIYSSSIWRSGSRLIYEEER